MYVNMERDYYYIEQRDNREKGVYKCKVKEVLSNGKALLYDANGNEWVASLSMLQTDFMTAVRKLT